MLLRSHSNHDVWLRVTIKNEVLVFTINKIVCILCMYYYAPGGLFHPSDDHQELAFRQAVERINADRSILPRSKLVAQIERISPFDSFHAGKRGKQRAGVWWGGVDAKGACSEGSCTGLWLALHSAFLLHTCMFSTPTKFYSLFIFRLLPISSVCKLLCFKILSVNLLHRTYSMYIKCI